MHWEESKEEITAPDIESPVVTPIALPSDDIPVQQYYPLYGSSVAAVSRMPDIAESSSGGGSSLKLDIPSADFGIVANGNLESTAAADGDDVDVAADVEGGNADSVVDQPKEPDGEYNAAAKTSIIHPISTESEDSSSEPLQRLGRHNNKRSDLSSPAQGTGAVAARRSTNTSKIVNSNNRGNRASASQPNETGLDSVSNVDKEDVAGDAAGDAAGDGPGFLSKVRRRTAHVTDLVTGRVGSHREHKASIRSSSETQAMSSSMRLRQSVQKELAKMFSFRGHQDEDMDDFFDSSHVRSSMHGRLMVTPSRHSTGSDGQDAQTGVASNIQYRLQAVKAKSGLFTRLLGWVGFSPGQAGIYEDAGDPTSGCACCGIRPNELVIRYLNWTFRASFFAVIFSGAVAFFGLNLFFAFLIWWSGKNRPSCIYVNGEGFGKTSASFADAFALSWTTFSTTGYGIIFPATSAVEPDVRKCIGITLITSLESFVGLLFGSCCGAVIFGKISRIQSYAQVIFSVPIVVRYGKGVLSGNDDDASSVGSAAKGANGDGDSGGKAESREPLPCPVLEFRLVNTFHSKTGGEIIDATMNIIASIDESQACPTIRAAARRHHRKEKKKPPSNNRSALASRGALRRNQGNQMSTSSLSIPAIPETKAFSRADQESSKSIQSGPFAQTHSSKDHQAFQEDPSGNLIPPRIFSRLSLQTGHDHPFFKRVWVAQHVIDEHSPLLKAEARQMVQRNHGYWPHELNSHEAVRDSIHFDQILVSFSGTSNVDASSVYAQKAYHWIDLNVGYRFVNLLYRDEQDGSLRVDSSLINDVTMQAGGGGEPLIDVDGDHKRHDLFIL